MRRREFIAGLGGAAAWPLAARAQQPYRMRLIGVLMGVSESDPVFQLYFVAFVEELARLGWLDGRNVRIDQHWVFNDVDQMRVAAKELVALQPDAIFALGTPAMAALQRETPILPIVFMGVADPVGSGFIAGLPRPGGNITGFQYIEGEIAGRWLQMIKEIAPHIRRAAAMYHPDSAPFAKYFLGPFEAAAQVLMVEPIIAPVRTSQKQSTIVTRTYWASRNQDLLLILSS
jgi:putative tryptophan/tyrosine transport system substrate-binding protein